MYTSTSPRQPHDDALGAWLGDWGRSRIPQHFARLVIVEGHARLLHILAGDRLA